MPSTSQQRERTSDFYRYFISAYPWRTAGMTLLMVVGGLAEGVGVLSMVPVLDLAEGEGQPSSELGQRIVDALATIGIEATLGTLLTGIVVLIVIKAFLLWLAQQQIGYTVARVTRDLRLQLIRALLKVRWRYLGERTIGQFANAVSTEAIRASAAYREACQVLAAAVQVVAYLAVATAISWEVALGTMVVVGLLTLFYRGFFVSTREAGRDQTRLNKALQARLVDVLQGIKPLKAMAREDLVRPMLESEAEGLNQAQRQQVLASGNLKAFQEPVVAVLLGVGLYMMLVVGDYALSSVLVLALVFYRLMQHINTLQVRYQTMINGESAFFSLRDELERAAQERESTEGGKPFQRLRQGIRFERVSFSYGEHRVLDDVELEIPLGTFVAILGESGSGKTTLVDLLAGLHQPDSGRILVDGTPLQELDLHAWRSQIGYVPQEMLLFNDTVFRNVTLGDEALTRDDARRALQMAGAWGFVQDKPEGMDHPIGERGGMLSGGQRQRIAIARALVTRPSLLILDEVTTALDPATERAICETLKNLGDEVTILSISHQPAMREVADLAYEMSNGRLAVADPLAAAR